MLNLHHLSIFHRVAETGSVSRAAELLLISQPAVSKQIRQLELSMKTTLLDRHPRGVRLTESGKVLADYARRIFELAGEAESAMSDLAGVKRGSLSVGAGPTAGVYLLPAVIVRFRREHPQVSLRVETENADVLKQRLADGAVDLAISEAAIDVPGLARRAVCDDRLVPILPAGHPMARRKNIPADEFCRLPFVTRATAGDGPSLVERTLARRNRPVVPVMTVGSTEAIKQAVIAGVGAAVVSRLAVATEIAANLLVVADVRGLSVRCPVWHVWRKDRAVSAAAKAFVAMVAGRR
jgi:DNA-binding transcriptional LysR family regulator